MLSALNRTWDKDRGTDQPEAGKIRGPAKLKNLTVSSIIYVTAEKIYIST